MVVLPLHSSSRTPSQSSSVGSPPLFSKSLPSFGGGGRKWADYQQLPRYTQKLRNSSRRNAALLVLAIIAILYFAASRIPHSPGGRAFRRWKGIPYFGRESPHYTDGVCRLNMTTMEPFGLTKEFSYARRYIQQAPFARGSNPKASLAWVDDLKQNMFPGLDYLSLGDGELKRDSSNNIIDLHSCSPKPLKMHMRQQHKPVNAKKHVFGMATTAERLLEYASTTALWLGNTGARLIVIVPTGPRVQELRDHLANLGIIATVLTSNEEFLVNYFKLIEAFFAHGHPDSQWYTFVDDDTHFFSLPRFVDALRIYDPSTEIYLGNPSEDLRQMRYDGLFAFGGAGVTVSRGLLDHLHQEYYACLSEQQPWVPGDVRVKRCVYQHTETKLTILEGLHQIDLIGENIGLLEGPRPPITWHHHRSWSPAPVDLISRAGQVCDGACLFQRWKLPIPSDFGYGFMTLHFGVSIVGYSVGIRPDLSKTETTWAVYPESNFDHSLAPLRMGLQEGRDRFTYRLKGIGKDVDGRVKHTYIKYVDREKIRSREEKRKQVALDRANSTVTIAEEDNKGSTDNDIDEVMELVFL